MARETERTTLVLSDLASIQSSASHNERKDVLCILKYENDAEIVTNRSGTKMVKRDIGIIDASVVLMTLTLWGSRALTFESHRHERMVLLARVVVRVYEGRKSLSMANDTMFVVEPTSPQIRERVDELRLWWQARLTSVDRFKVPTVSLTSTYFAPWLATFDVVRDSGFGVAEGMPARYKIDASIDRVYVDETFYDACTNIQENCTAALVLLECGKFFCRSCRAYQSNPFRRFLLHIRLIDSDGNQQWVKLFHDEARYLLNTTAQALSKLKETRWRDYVRLVRRLEGRRFVWTLRLLSETFSGVTGMSTIVNRLRKVDEAAHNESIRRELARPFPCSK